MLVPQYISWHYSLGFSSGVRNLINFIKFEFDFFSVKDLILTLFAPFQRLKEKNTGSLIDIENILSILVVNIIMRVVGLLVRTAILICAFFCISISIIASVCLVILWTVLPFILLALAIGSMIAYFKYKP